MGPGRCQAGRHMPCHGPMAGWCVSGSSTPPTRCSSLQVGHHFDLSMRGWQAVSTDTAHCTVPANMLNDHSCLGSRTVFEYVLGITSPGGYVRTFTFVNPKKAPSPNDTRCVQRQQYCIFQVRLGVAGWVKGFPGECWG